MKYLYLLLLLAGSATLAASTEMHASIVERMPTLVIQLGIIIFAARIGSIVVEKAGIPGVLGELLAGVIIGPYLLGAIPIPGFEHGLFANSDPSFPIQPELYGIAVIASIILLFLSGLETDLTLFIRFSVAGTIVGVGGIIFSFLAGALTGTFFLHLPISDPKCLFLGIMSTATSVGITARILSERKKMDTPEGVTIIAGAVIDDVLGVILLAIVLGISLQMKSGGGSALNWGSIGLIALKEIGIWLGFTLVGLYFAKRISRFLQSFKDRFVFSVIALSFALVIAGVFERAGLAMIIGAYIVGLSLSKTEISFAIQEAMHPLRIFFVPVFFVVMGMLVDIKALLVPSTLIFGLVYTVGAVLSKLIGCGLPALFLNFNWLGAKRIGLGMIPRGEVALIIAGIGLSYGLLTDANYNIFGIAIMMTLITTLVSPPLLNRELRKDKAGTRSSTNMPEKETIRYQLDDHALTDLMSHKLIQQFQAMGFFVNQVDPEALHYNLRRQNISITLQHQADTLILQTDKENTVFVRRMMYEAAFSLKQSANGILNMEDLHAIQSPTGLESPSELRSLLKGKQIIPRLKAESKEGIIWELVTALHSAGKIPQVKSIYYTVMERENHLSGGLAHGFAIPHAHTDEVSEPLIAIGIKPAGIDFDSIDNKPSFLFFLILTPVNDANVHIRLLSSISRLSKQPQAMSELLRLEDAEQIRTAILNLI